MPDSTLCRRKNAARRKRGRTPSGAGGCPRLVEAVSGVCLGNRGERSCMAGCGRCGGRRSSACGGCRVTRWWSRRWWQRWRVTANGLPGSSGLKCEPLGFLAICPSHWLSSPSAFQGGSRLRSTALSRNVERGAVMASVTIDVDLPPGVEITGYERHQDGHGFEVRWPLPERCCCQRCGHEDTAHIEFKTTPQVIRDLNVW